MGPPALETEGPGNPLPDRLGEPPAPAARPVEADPLLAVAELPTPADTADEPEPPPGVPMVDC